MRDSFFKLQSSFKADYAPASIRKWRSSRTGLQLTLVHQQSPIVNGYFAVGTEILNDSGCPHTLEHLVFMGSKKYPWKGLLDILGNLAFSGTNAWTATDQTVYTLTTAGWDGFRMLLPVYLDHVLYPTITDAACYTEVYHIDGDAKDKGVVYSEMQGIENQSYFIEGLETQRTLYKKSGYKSETGGLTKNLRTLKNDTIRQYHADNYRPDNLCVIISGSVDESELLDVMSQFDSQLEALPAIPHARPFVDTEHDLPLTESAFKNVQFPDEDESASEIQISWIGPDGRDMVLEQAIDILGKYFTSSPISLFSKNFIEIDHSLATASEFYTDSYYKTGMNLLFNNVPTSEADSLPQKVLKLMEEHCDPSKLDLIRLRDLVEQSRRQYVFAAEKSPDSMVNVAIFEFSYGDVSGSDLQPWLETLREFDVVMKWDINKWLEVYRTYFLENRPCIVVAKPSSKLYLTMKEENEKLIRDRRAELGEEGLKDLERRLEDAEAQNNKPIPKKILDSFVQPDPARIRFILTRSVGVGLNRDVKNDPSDDVVKRILANEPKDLPLYIHVENIESNFATIHLLFSSFELEEKYLPYISVFKAILSLPMVKEDGDLIPYEDVVKQLKRDTVHYDFSSSFLGSFGELLDFTITVPNKNYERGIDWFYRIMFKTRFTKDRVLVALNKLVKSLPEIKRSGPTMMYSIINKTCFTDRSLRKACDTYQQEKFLIELLSKAQTDDGFNELEKVMNTIRKRLFHLKNTRVLLILDSSKVKEPISSWLPFVRKVEKEAGSSDQGPLAALPLTSNAMSVDGLQKKKKCVIITTPGSDASYMSLQTAVPFDFLSKDSFKIILGSEYLQCVEGPFWKAIRGTGLAYGANMSKDFEGGKLSFSIYRGADVEKCYDVAKKLVSDYASGAISVEEKMRLGAISSLVSSLANSQSNYFEAASRGFFDDALAKRGPEYNKRLMEELTQISTEDLVYIFKKWFVNLFNPEHSICFISCNPAQGDSIAKHFGDIGYEVTVEQASAGGEQGEEDEEEDEEWEEIEQYEAEPKL
ncbi:DEKNAAC100497 [Brettanomyces naardenensis]|uniref:DEKNAAC100497 n=1 Tax=Brettanomyces naardenensis TaxID=13370 RepID=A0A448YFV9_BRENA|nr:DEKNAAC100497 [Brettanomyces naardenensis]